MSRKDVGSFFERWYVTIVFFLWAFVPEIRRLLDWERGFSTLPIINLLPLLSLIPAIFVLKQSWSLLGRTYRTVALIWVISFAYALFVAYATGGLIGGLYDVLSFVLPVGMGVLLAQQSGKDFKAAYERTASSLLWIAAAAGVYGIWQYVHPPPWDVFWVDNANLGSIGSPVPFGLRVFGPLNAPGPFADFLTLAIIANLPRLRLKSLLSTILIAPCLVALALSLVRTDWIGLILATVLYLLLSPKRRDAAGSLFAVALTCCLFVVVLISTVPGASNAVESISNRFGTFGSLNEDSSVIARQGETNAAIQIGIHEPLGQGAGTVGVSAKLGAGGGTVTVDNGYISRFLEMGWLGSAGYAVAILLAVGSSLLAYTRMRRGGDVDGASFAAFAVALQVLLLYFDAASDHHVGFSALFFWYSLYLASRALEDKPASVHLRSAHVSDQVLRWSRE